MKRYDIVFDFSSSPSGGALRRIEAYASFFSNSDFDTLFLVHEDILQRIKRFRGINVVPVEKKKSLTKAVGIGKYLNILEKKPYWFFSYGIPLSRPVGENNWLHISNILPLYLDKVSTSFSLYLKMYLYKLHLKFRSSNCDIVSAESEFSLGLYSKHICSNTHQVLLKNGITDRVIFDNNCNKLSHNYAIAVGTYNYKRLDITYKLFRSIKDEYKLMSLIIIGNEDYVPKNIRCQDDVKLISSLCDEEYFLTLSRAEIFISTSIVENSSNAVIEGLSLSKKIIISDIPSHREILSFVKGSNRNIAGYDMLVFDKKSISINKLESWHLIINKMLSEMKLLM